MQLTAAWEPFEKRCYFPAGVWKAHHSQESFPHFQVWQNEICNESREREGEILERCSFLQRLIEDTCLFFPLKHLAREVGGCSGQVILMVD